VCSLGEAGTYGTPEERREQAVQGAELLGATIEFVDLGGDAHMDVTVPNVIHLASRIRAHRPRIVLAPTPTSNQHPDHARVGQMVRDAARVARYGGVHELRDQPAHAIGLLLFYAVTPEAEPKDVVPLLYDVSAEATMATWKQAMEAHESQTKGRGYVELQLTRARMRGLTAGLGHAIPLFPNESVVIASLDSLSGSARHF
jgi:LmbE family N-acetylglucosaminyl deacetylase